MSGGLITILILISWSESWLGRRLFLSNHFVVFSLILEYANAMDNEQPLYTGNEKMGSAEFHRVSFYLKASSKCVEEINVQVIFFYFWSCGAKC